MTKLPHGIALGLALIPSVLCGQSMVSLGPLSSGKYSWAYDISRNGLVVVGDSIDSTGSLNAFFWSLKGGMFNIGTKGSRNTHARGTSFDGSVVVGYTTGNYDGAPDRAFYWTRVNGISELGFLPGGTDSIASDVSADGRVIVGHASTPEGNRAFRWTKETGMVSLGTLELDSSISLAEAVSGDGNVIVGWSHTRSSYGGAFRWTPSTGMVDIGTLGTSSIAYGMSSDGEYIVGMSVLMGGLHASYHRAFRWNKATGMQDLGHLGGNSSYAFDISDDGSVVVGESTLEKSHNRAFRWTEKDGMINIGTLPGYTDSKATAVSADGNVITGVSYNVSGDINWQARSFIYSNRGMLDAADWSLSVSETNSILSISLELTRLHIEGAHHRPLGELCLGRSYWATGDVASSSRYRDLITRSGEAGATFEPWSNVLIGVGGGYGSQYQQLRNDSSATTFGQYLVSELDFLLAEGGILSFLVSSGDWENETNRGYLTGNGIDYSHGTTDIKSTAFRLRYDSPSLVKILGVDLNAYASYGHNRARAEGFVETGGAYPSSYGEMDQTEKVGRLGFAATRSFGDKFSGRLSAEWIRRFDRDRPALIATDITSTLALSFPGNQVVRDQARFGLDIDYLMDAKTTLSFTVHASGYGESPDVSGAISLRRAY